MIKKRGIFLGTLLAMTCCVAFLGMTKSNAHYQTQGSVVLQDGSSSKDIVVDDGNVVADVNEEIEGNVITDKEEHADKEELVQY